MAYGRIEMGCADGDGAVDSLGNGSEFRCFCGRELLKRACAFCFAGSTAVRLSLGQHIRLLLVRSRKARGSLALGCGHARFDRGFPLQDCSDDIL